MGKKFLRDTISNFSYAFLVIGIAYHALPYFGYQLKFLLKLEQQFVWVDTLVNALIVLGAIGAFYIYKTGKDDDDGDENEENITSAD